jgi:GTPase obg
LLFLIPADSKDIIAEYHILLNELKEYNPELLDKDRLIAISKSDMLDDELTEAIRQEVAAGLGDTPFLFISSVSGKGIQQLKDKLWEMIQ